MVRQLIGRVISLGTTGLSERKARQYWAINATTLFVVVITVGYASFYFAYQAPTFWREALFLSAMVLSYMAVFALTASKKVLPALVVLTGVGVTHLGTATWLLGQQAGAHLYLLIVPVLVALCSDQKRIWLIWPTALVAASVFLFVELFRPEGSLVLLPEWIPKLLLAADVIGTILLATVLAFVFQRLVNGAENALEAEHARSEALLYNLLPEDIAARLKAEPDQTIADSLPQVAILFADIVDFTPRAASLPPEEVVGFLNKIFRAFDVLAEKHGLEKIKTIGDAYMVAAGMPNPCANPVHQVAEMALDMQWTVAEMSSEFPGGLQVRIGLHAGPVVAGVIGNRKLFYDVWGQAVNTASRMESHGQPGRIQVTTAAREVLGDDYVFEPRGMVEVKGMGKVPTWFLTGAKAQN